MTWHYTTEILAWIRLFGPTQADVDDLQVV